MKEELPGRVRLSSHPASEAKSMPPGRYVNRRQLAKRITEELYVVSARSLERWPLVWRLVNGKAVTNEEEGMAEARRRLKEAPAIRGGRRSGNAVA